MLEIILCPRHGAASVNMVEGCPGKFRVFQVEHIRESLIRLHQSLRRLAFVRHQHDYDVCEFCSREDDCPIVKEDIQKLLDQRIITITYDPGNPGGIRNDQLEGLQIKLATMKIQMMGQLVGRMALIQDLAQRQDRKSVV